MKPCFWCGVGLGMMAGAAVGMMMTPPDKKLKKAANRALKTMGEAVEEFTSALSR